MNKLSNPKKEEEKLTFTPPSAKEEEDFHAKLHREMEEAKKAKSAPESIFGGDLNPIFDLDEVMMDSPLAAMDGMMAQEMAMNDPIGDMMDELMGGGIKVRPMMDVESVEIEDQVLPDGNHVHKEKHMKNGVESVSIRSDRPMTDN